MKKTYTLTHEKIKYPRLIDAAKHDVKKYLRRERNKDLPKDSDYWDFDCKFGTSNESAKSIHLSAINEHIDEIASKNLPSFYLEIIAKPAVRTKKDTTK